MSKPVARSRVALITTAAPFKPDAGDQGPWAPYNAAAKFTEVYSMPIEPPPDLRISHVGYDRKHTSAEDINTYFPLQRLKEAAADGPNRRTQQPVLRSAHAPQPAPNAANAMPHEYWRCAARMASMRRSWSRPDRSATRP